MMAARADPWVELAASLEEFAGRLSRSRATHVSTASLRDAARSIVQDYFRIARAELVQVGCTKENIETLDASMQSLLQLANGRNRRTSYLRLISGMRELVLALEGERELRLGEQLSHPPASDRTSEGAAGQIISTLEGLVPSAALSYEQAMLDLAEGSRVSYRGTANELREALRETLDYLAPDDQVMQADGFQLEQGRARPTQRQKVRYILRSRGRPARETKSPEDAASLVEGLTASLARSVYERSSVSAHVGTTRQEVEQVRMYVETVLADLLEIHRD
jgi:hypothetical protein